MELRRLWHVFNLIAAFSYGLALQASCGPFGRAWLSHQAHRVGSFDRPTNRSPWELTRNNLQSSVKNKHQAAASPRLVSGLATESPKLARASSEPYAGRGVRPGQIVALEFRMGNVYSELVMNCLNAQTQSSSSAHEELDDGLVFQESIVSTLRSMLEMI